MEKDSSGSRSRSEILSPGGGRVSAPPVSDIVNVALRLRDDVALEMNSVPLPVPVSRSPASTVNVKSV